jgi:hypothetical protein
MPQGNYEYSMIGLGAVIINSNFKKLDEFSYNNYVASETLFEPKCMEDFWSKNSETLKKLEYVGSLTKEEREKEMIEKFQEFRSKWEFLYCI